MSLEEEYSPEDEAPPEAVPVPSSLVPHLNETAVPLDIDGSAGFRRRRRARFMPPGLPGRSIIWAPHNGARWRRQRALDQ